MSDKRKKVQKDQDGDYQGHIMKIHYHDSRWKDTRTMNTEPTLGQFIGRGESDVIYLIFMDGFNWFFLPHVAISSNV